MLDGDPPLIQYQLGLALQACSRNTKGVKDIEDDCPPLTSHRWRKVAAPLHYGLR